MNRSLCLSSFVLAILVLGEPRAAMGQQDRGLLVTSWKDDGTIVGALEGKGVNLGHYTALLIGINDYVNDGFAAKLLTPVTDVQRLRDVLIRKYGFAPERVHLLTDSAATRRGILAALARVRDARLGAADNLLIYYAGHGYQDPNTEDGFWIPVDGTPEESTWISVAEIRRILKKITAKHVLLISDSCFSGTLTRASITIPKGDRYLREVLKNDSYQVITSGGLEPVADGGRDGMSLFAYSLVDYLDHQSRPYVSAGQLYADVSPIVANASASAQTPEHGRIPGTFDKRGQFVLARVDYPGTVPPVAGSAEREGSVGARVGPAAGPRKFKFHTIEFVPPKQWTVADQQENTIHWKRLSGNINLNSNALGTQDWVMGEEKGLRVVADSFISGLRNTEVQGTRPFRKARVKSQEVRQIGDFKMSFIEMQHQSVSFITYSFYDWEGGRIYVLAGNGAEVHKEMMEEAIQAMVATLELSR